MMRETEKRRSAIGGDALIALVPAAIAGTVAAAGGIAFNLVVVYGNLAWLPSPMPTSLAAPLGEMTWLYVVIPLAGGLLVGQLARLLPTRRPHGPADTILAAHSAPARIESRNGLVSSAMAASALACGASVGQYGPIVHLGATLGWLVARALRLSERLWETLLGAGVAGAVAAVFVAPLGGLLFAHEVVLRHYALRSFAPIAVASVIGYVGAELVFPRPMALAAPSAALMQPLELVLLAGLGLLAGAVAVVYMRAIDAAHQLGAALSLAAPVKPALAGLIIGLVGLMLPQLLGLGLATTDAALMGQLSGGMAAILLAGKILAVAMCLGLGFYGGVFSPALFVGAMLGAAYAAVLDAAGLLGGGTGLASALAVAGMAGVVSAVVGAPIATIVIVLELTGNYEMALGATVTVVLANLVSSRLYGRSLFDRQLLRRGYDLSLGRERIALARMTVAPWIAPATVILGPDASPGEARNALLAADAPVAHLVDNGGRYVGRLTLSDLVRAEAAGASPVSVAALARMPSVVLRDDQSLLEAMETLERFIGEDVPVVRASEGGRFVGVLHEAAVFRAYRQVSRAVRRHEVAAEP